MSVCKKICKDLYAKPQWGESRYIIGQKYCMFCKIFMYCDGDNCPCCNETLRTKSKRKNML